MNFLTALTTAWILQTAPGVAYIQPMDTTQLYQTQEQCEESAMQLIGRTFEKTHCRHADVEMTYRNMKALNYVCANDCNVLRIIAPTTHVRQYTMMIPGMIVSFEEGYRIVNYKE